MKKRLRFGLVIGAVIAVLAIGGIFGGRALLLHADSNLPGDNCVPNGAAATITITHGAIESSLASFSPGICYSFVVTNNDKQAHDFLIEQPSDKTVLAASTNIAAGKTVTLNYQFAPANSETPVNLVYSAAGETTPQVTTQLFLAQ